MFIAMLVVGKLTLSMIRRVLEMLVPKVKAKELRHQRDIVADKCDMVAMICETIYTLKIKEETKVDWSKVPVDTPVLVSVNGVDWFKRYFAKTINGEVRTWTKGATSWSADDDNDVSLWKYAKLAESEDNVE